MATKAKAIERNPVILSLLILKDMGIEDAQHGKMTDLWGPLWTAVVAYRDDRERRGHGWDQRALDGILSGQATFDSGEAWVKLNDILNQCWARFNE